MDVLNSRLIFPFLAFFFIYLIPVFHWKANAFERDFHGQLSGWTKEVNIKDEWENNTGILYIPEANFRHALNAASALDAELSLYCFAVTGSGPYEEDNDLDLYRTNIRYITTQTETRVGLQKINFGQAQLLRPLRWFDRVDPTDPLQLSEGVYALRFRYDALNTANVWLWGLYGNDDPMGYEPLPTEKNSLEIGGRFQYPILHGDLAVTLHTRQVDGSRYHIPDFRENRLGLDGRWDMVVGIWFETSFAHQKKTHFSNEWTKRSTIGLDYTFDIGNGLYVLAEHMTTVLSDEAFRWEEDFNVSAFSMNYPVGIMDSLNAIGYYDWDQKRYYQYLNWARTYDNVIINISLFYYPETETENLGFIQDNPFNGSGGQLMITFNH